MTSKKCANACRMAVQERSRSLVDAVLESAIRIFSTKGLAKTTTTEIAEKAGASIGSLYEYFPDKEAIFLKVVEMKVEAGTKRLIDALDADVKNLRSIRGIFRLLSAVYFDLYSENEVLIRSFREVVLDIRSVPGIIERSDTLVAARVEELLNGMRGKKIPPAGISASVMVRSIHAMTRALTLRP